MRERIEDLGRITAMLEKVLDMDVFEEHTRPRRPKDTWEWMESFKDQEQLGENLMTLFYGIEELSSALYEIREIATGQDFLNEPPS